MTDLKVYVHYLAYNSIATHGVNVLESSISSILKSKNLNLELVVTDNASSDKTLDELKKLKENYNFILKENKENLGFCGAHNKELFNFLNSDKDFFLITTHDVFFKNDTIFNLANVLNENNLYGFATPIFFRADKHLKPIEPKEIDASGMYLNTTLRHFDSKQIPSGEVTEVFGGTGASLLVKKNIIKKLTINTDKEDQALFKIYPQLEKDSDKRIKLFDEAFFAYREDADLAWRANLLGVKTVLVKSAEAFHKRLVLPERRSILPDKINALGVRNRFLLQFNNYFFKDMPFAFFNGIIFRNLVVILGVLLKERSSIIAFKEVFLLMKRGIVRRKILCSRIKELNKV